jgi:D-cysteine desulfhydrase family pyridoxal phosphate-dependent enzyme
MNLYDRPRASLCAWPTPLEECPRLSAAVGGPHLWVKRDDLTGLGLGGNKVRKLEYLLGDAVRRGADTIVTTGARQSNHARLTAAACRRLGFEVVLVLAEIGRPDAPPQGNYLLDRLYGAEIVTLADDSDEAVERAMREVAEGLTARGRRPYVIPLGGSNPIGVLGYLVCALEIASQAQAEGVFFDHVFVTTGSGGTHAGLQLGAALFLPGTTVHGVSVSRPAGPAAARVDALVGSTADLLGLRPNPAPPALVHGEYVGEGYAIPTQAGWEAILLAARTEGLILDPVYTGKALSGLIGLVHEGALPTTSNVLFVHTGGAPGLMAQAEALDKYLVETAEAHRQTTAEAHRQTTAGAHRQTTGES